MKKIAVASVLLVGLLILLLGGCATVSMQPVMHRIAPEPIARLKASSTIQLVERIVAILHQDGFKTIDVRQNREVEGLREASAKSRTRDVVLVRLVRDFDDPANYVVIEFGYRHEEYWVSTISEYKEVYLSTAEELARFGSLRRALSTIEL